MLRLLNNQQVQRRFFNRLLKPPTVHCVQANRSVALLHSHKSRNPQQEACCHRFLSTSLVACLQHEATDITNDLVQDNATTITPVVSEPLIEFNDIAQSSLDSAPEVFADYGLGGYDAPHHLVQSALEFLHSQMGIHWIPTLIIATVTCRLIALPAYIKMRSFIARSNNLLPQQLKIQEEMHKSMGFEKSRKQAQYLDFIKQNDINPLKPLLFQLPTLITFMSFFAALKGMSAANLPSLTTAGLWWFENLTIPDPYFALPFLSCLSLHLLIRFGGATSEAGPAASIPAFKKFLMWSPFIMLPFFIYQPSSMFIFWMTSNAFSLFQMTLFLNPNVQKFFKIPPLVKHPDSVIKQMNPFEQIRKQKERQMAAQRAARKVKEHMNQLNQFSKDNKDT